MEMRGLEGVGVGGCVEDRMGYRRVNIETPLLPVEPLLVIRPLSPPLLPLAVGWGRRGGAEELRQGSACLVYTSGAAGDYLSV